MATDRASRRPVSGPPGGTLADLLAKIGADENIANRRRQDLCSALRTLAKALGRRPEEVPAHPGAIRERLKGFSPAMAALAPRRWRNVLSLVRAALEHAGLADVPGRYRLPLTPEWRDLYRYLNRKALQIGLSRFLRYCSANGIMPDQVGDAVMNGFREDITKGGLVRRPREVHRSTCLLWNHAAETLAPWPKQRLTVPSHIRTYALPWTAFPETFWADVQSYLDRLAGKDLLAELDFRPLRPASIRTRELQLRQFASALVLRGRDPATLRSLADLVGIDAFKEGLRFFLARSAEERPKNAHDIACVIKAVARHWVKVDEAHLAELRALCRRLDPGRRGLTQKNRGRLRQFDDRAHVGALVNLPQRLVAEVRRNRTISRADALHVQMALAIELLLMVPMRVGNLAKLDLERHIVRSRLRGRGIVHLTIPGEEVKNRVDIEAVLPAPTVALLDEYLETYRPLLLRQRSSWLFPGEATGPKSRHGIAAQISSTIREKTGLLVHPHLFRHIAAKLYLDANPGAYGVIRLVHGHKSVETTLQFYCGTETSAAMRHFDEHVLKLREHLPPARARRPRAD